VPIIEQLFSAGYSHEQIHAEVVGSGLSISFENYKKILMRERKRATVLSDIQVTISRTPSPLNVHGSTSVTGTLNSLPANPHDLKGPSGITRLGERTTIVQPNHGKPGFKWDPKQEIDAFKPIEEL
jgi:hypothetical protein